MSLLFDHSFIHNPFLLLLLKSNPGPKAHRLFALCPIPHLTLTHFPSSIETLPSKIFSVVILFPSEEQDNPPFPI